MSKTYVVAVDGSDHGWKALDLATSLAKDTGAVLVVIHVIPYEALTLELKNYAKSEGLSVEEVNARYHASRGIGDRIASDAEARVRQAGFSEIITRVVEGHPAERIVEVAKSEGADMIFLGSRGLSSISDLLMGGVSHKVMHLAPCTCVAVK